MNRRRLAAPLALALIASPDARHWAAEQTRTEQLLARLAAADSTGSARRTFDAYSRAGFGIEAAYGYALDALHYNIPLDGDIEQHRFSIYARRLFPRLGES